jgi:hypothetical protein
MTDQARAYRTRLYQRSPAVALVPALAKEFATVPREHAVARWYTWLRGVELSGVTDRQGVARSRWRARQASEVARCGLSTCPFPADTGPRYCFRPG